MLFPLYHGVNDTLETSVLNNLFFPLSLPQAAPSALLGPALNLEICLRESRRVTRLEKRLSNICASGGRPWHPHETTNN